MKSIILKSITLINFKGIKDLTIDNFQQSTDIFGANGTGKTTIFDAFVWLLFGKDSTDRQKFEIKTLDKNNNPIPKIDHEVSAILEIDGQPTEVRRILREKWVKARGSEVAEFSGNETVYYWNEVPVLAGDFSNKISQIVDENVFKLITNPTAFNNLPWKDQRSILESFGTVSDHQIAEKDEAFQGLINKLNGSSLDEYQKKIAASIKKSKEQLKMIPTRIDEVERSKPALEVSESKLRHELAHLEKELTDIDASLASQAESEKQLHEKKADYQRKINALRSEISQLEFQSKQDAEKTIREANAEITSLNSQLSSKKLDLSSAEKALATLVSEKDGKKAKLTSLENSMAELRKNWSSVNASSFEMPDDQTCCPTCKQELPKDQIESKREELKSNFDTRKKRQLDDITTNGKNLETQKELLKSDIETTTTRIENGKTKIEKLSDEVVVIEDKLSQQSGVAETRTVDEVAAEILEANKEIPTKKKEIDSLQAEMDSLSVEDPVELKAKKAELRVSIDGINKELTGFDQIKKADERIAQLMEEEKTLAGLIASEEKEQFTIENFLKAKADELEKQINKKFKVVEFKMFETQINGGQIETCKALVSGVPFSDANTASKVNAGVDIINTLCEHFGVRAPIFIDNRESVIELIDTESQLINLIVSDQDKKLRIEPRMVAELETAI